LIEHVSLYPIDYGDSGFDRADSRSIDEAGTISVALIADLSRALGNREVSSLHLQV
jgi:hypothetical protein